MNLVTKALRRQFVAISNNKTVLALLVLTAACVLYLAYVHGEVPHAIAYLSALWMCTLATDILTINKQPIAIPVKKPVRESVLILASVLIGTTGMMLRFTWLDWEQTAGIVRLLVAGMMILFTFPIVVGAVLLLSRYKLKDLGFRISPLIFTGVLSLVITAGTAFLVAPDGIKYHAIIKEVGGIGGMLFMGFITAALPEEFLRLILQTRLGALFNDKALAWYLACLLWAFLHFPKWYGEGGDMFEGVFGAIRIIPLGLMWSYMIHRTKNIFPSIIAHGLNIWGLQNF